jgi:hypothetical protein
MQAIQTKTPAERGLPIGKWDHQLITQQMYADPFVIMNMHGYAFSAPTNGSSGRALARQQ